MIDEQSRDTYTEHGRDEEQKQEVELARLKFLYLLYCSIKND